jgi:hypothetical protein
MFPLFNLKLSIFLDILNFQSDFVKLLNKGIDSYFNIMVL